MKLPAAVAFPTDDRLLKRLEDSRRALPPNSVKALRKPREADVEAPLSRIDAWAIDKPLVPGESRTPTLQLVRIEELYLRNRVAPAQR
jgi:hypothetical protein